MNNEDMIVWFIKELGLAHQDVAEMLTELSVEGKSFQPKHIKQMMLKRSVWPSDTWDVLRSFTSQKIADVQKSVLLFNETGASTFKVSSQELGSPIGRLGVIMSCILLADNIPILVD